jgi:N-acetylneuraminic acid mutarotase
MKRQTTKILCSLAVLFLAVVVLVPFSKAQIAPTRPLACTGSWSAGATLPSPVVRAVGVFFPANGKLYAMGGRSADTAGSDFTHPFEYDPVSNSWTTKSATYADNQVNNMACGVLTDAGTPYIYCVGGSAATQTTAASRVFRYDPVTDALSGVAAPWPGAAGTTLPGGFTIFQNKLYILGGFNIPGGVSTNQIWEFTPTTNVWVQKAAVLPVPLSYIPTTTIGTLIFTGGGSSISGGIITDATDSFVYNPVADSISTIANIPRATGETRALNFMGQMWVMGGGRTAPNPSNEVDIYDPVAGTWSIGPAFTTPRRNFPTDTDGSSRIWLAGGYANDQITPLSSMEIFQCAATPTPTPTNTPTNTPTPPPSTLTALSPARLWVGLKNSDDQGTQFDIKVEILKNGTPVASGLQRCMTGLTRNPNLAQLSNTAFDAFAPVTFGSGDVLSLRISTRIGTNPDGTKCAGPGGSHNNATGLRLYYDAASRASHFDATISPNPNTNLYLHSDGGVCPGGDGDSPGVTTRFLDAIAPVAANPRCKNSGSVNFAGGNPFSLVGTWSLAPF